ncbi:MAG: 6-carboxytetrahydropterin synthase QueD [Pseudomonadota bacterium]
MRVSLKKRFRIEAAHRLPNVSEDHKCFRLHGHSFGIEVVVEGEVDSDSGWLIDYADIEEAFAPVFSKLDHRYLNEVPGLENPTSENLACWIWKRLEEKLPLAEIRIHETCVSACVYKGEGTRKK